jgi:hypothetical protein
MIIPSKDDEINFSYIILGSSPPTLAWPILIVHTYWTVNNENQIGINQKLTQIQL